MKCPRCQAETMEGAAFCTACGTPLTVGAGATPVTYPPYSVQPPIPEQYRPISAWGYFGYNLLFSIPVVGFILLIVFAFSDSNINLRNYARSFFCGLVIVGVLLLVCIILGVVFGTVVGVSEFAGTM